MGENVTMIILTIVMLYSLRTSPYLFPRYLRPTTRIFKELRVYEDLSGRSLENGGGVFMLVDGLIVG